MAKFPVIFASLVLGSAGAVAQSTEDNSATSPQSSAQTETVAVDSTKASSGVILPESAVLPERVGRFRAAYANVEGDYGYDSKGDKSEKGITVKGVVGAAVFEYGLTPRISMQVLAPLRKSTSFEVTDKTDFSSYLNIESKVTEAVNGQFAQILSVATIAALYNSNTAAPQNIPITGTAITIPSGAPVKTYLDQVKATLISTTVASQYDLAKSQAEATKFDKGLGDLEIGAKMNLSSPSAPMFADLPVYFSAALGLRLNSSGYADAVKNGITPFGRGTTDLGIRLNGDVDVVSGLQLQLENQSEMMLAKGETYVNAKEVSYERTGMRQIGYAKMVIAPGAWVPAVDMVRLSAKYNYDNDTKTKTDGVTQSDDASSKRTLTYGLSYNGFAQKIPVQVDLDLDTPLSGKNQAFVTTNKIVTLKLYNQF